MPVGNGSPKKSSPQSPKGVCYSWRRDGRCANEGKCSWKHPEDQRGIGGTGRTRSPSGARGNSKGRSGSKERGRSSSPGGSKKPRGRSPSGKTDKPPCMFYLRNKCDRGDKCDFWHPPVCHEYQKNGKCTRQGCVFLHRPKSASPARSSGSSRGRDKVKHKKKKKKEKKDRRKSPAAPAADGSRKDKSPRSGSKEKKSSKEKPSRGNRGANNAATALAAIALSTVFPTVGTTFVAGSGCTGSSLFSPCFPCLSDSEPDFFSNVSTCDDFDEDEYGYGFALASVATKR